MGRKPIRTKTNPRHAIAYIRVSTDATRQALGVDAQRAQIAAWAAANGVAIVAEYVEEISGGADLSKRIVLLEAIAALALHGAGVLVFAKWDRFARDPRAAALACIEIERVGARAVSADGVGAGDDPGARLMQDLLLAVASFEKSMIRARIKAALAVKASRGEKTGGAAPYGFRTVDGAATRLGKDGVTRPVRVLVADEGEQATIARARELRAVGHTLRAIVADLGPVSRKGTTLGVSALHAMLAEVPA